jgi:hypothetical protein
MDSQNDSDVLLKKLTLTFGGKPYGIPVLRMRQAAEWRKEFLVLTQEVSASMIIDTEGDKAQIAKQVGNALTGALLAFPEKIPQLVFSYAKSLPQEEIMEMAYDEDFSRAFGMIYKEAFSPFLVALGTALEMQRAQASRSGSSTNSN